MGLEHQENFLAQGLVDAYVMLVVMSSRDGRVALTSITAAGFAQHLNNDQPALSCERRVLGQSIIEPVNLHSDLLANFNQPIDLQHTYVPARCRKSRSSCGGNGDAVMVML